MLVTTQSRYISTGQHTLHETCEYISRAQQTQRKTLKTDLEGFLSSVDKLVSFQLGALHEGLPTLCTDVHARSVSVQVFPHGRVVSEHLGTALHAQQYSHTHTLRS